jgi:AraC-like DNA-binding protein
MSTQVAEARRFYLPADAQQSGTRVVSGGWERCDSSYEIRRNGFAHPTLEFVASGHGTLKMGGRSQPLERGVVFAYGPGVPHVITTDPAERLSKYFVNFAGRDAAALMRRSGIAPGKVLTVAAIEEVQATFEQLVVAGRRGTANAARIAALQGRILLLLLAEVRLPTGASSSGSCQTFLRCREYLEKHFVPVQTAAEAADACGVSHAYLSRIFRRFTGQPAYQFLMRLKMNQAAALLEHQGLNVNETADAFGMDPFHFSRAFKRVHGRPPSSFIPSVDS